MPVAAEVSSMIRTNARRFADAFGAIDPPPEAVYLRCMTGDTRASTEQTDRHDLTTVEMEDVEFSSVAVMKRWAETRHLEPDGFMWVDLMHVGKPKAIKKGTGIPIGQRTAVGEAKADPAQMLAKMALGTNELLRDLLKHAITGWMGAKEAEMKSETERAFAEAWAEAQDNGRSHEAMAEAAQSAFQELGPGFTELGRAAAAYAQSLGGRAGAPEAPAADASDEEIMEWWTDNVPPELAARIVAAIKGAPAPGGD